MLTGASEEIKYEQMDCIEGIGEGQWITSSVVLWGNSWTVCKYTYVCVWNDCPGSEGVCRTVTITHNKAELELSNGGVVLLLATS